MSPEGYKYFLPAFMSITIQNYMEADVIGDSTVNLLVPTNVDYLKGWQDERHCLFGREQRDAISSFLQYLMDLHIEEYDMEEMKLAINYWQT